METDLSLVHLVLGASPIVQGVMALLLLLSVVSWAMIIHKRRVLGRASREMARFEKQFWSGGDLATLYNDIKASDREALGMADIFESGFREFSRLRRQPGRRRCSPRA